MPAWSLIRPNGRSVGENDGEFQLREDMGTYIADADVKNGDIGDQNASYWDMNHGN